MEKFNLSVWLQDKSRKVVTRNGRPVRIVCWDIDSDTPILVAFRLRQDREEVFAYGTDGKSIVNPDYDLFFADEEEELTEFEKTIKLFVDNNEKRFKNGYIPTITDIKTWAEETLRLARKELEKSIEDGAIEFAKSYMEDVNPSFEKLQESEELWKWKMSCLRGINKAYIQGKKDALKDLPKWKKAKENRTLPDDVVKIDEGGMVIHSDMVWEGEYFIMFQSLKSLPKEE